MPYYQPHLTSMSPQTPFGRLITIFSFRLLYQGALKPRAQKTLMDVAHLPPLRMNPNTPCNGASVPRANPSVSLGYLARTFVRAPPFIISSSFQYIKHKDAVHHKQSDKETQYDLHTVILLI